MLFSATDHAKEALQKALASCDSALKLASTSKDLPYDLDRIFGELQKAERRIREAESEDRFAEVDLHGKTYDGERIKARIYFIQGSVATHPDMPDDVMRKGIGILETLVQAYPRDADARKVLDEARRRLEFRSRSQETPAQIGFRQSELEPYRKRAAGKLIDITPFRDGDEEGDESTASEDDPEGEAIAFLFVVAIVLAATAALLVVKGILPSPFSPQYARMINPYVPVARNYYQPAPPQAYYRPPNYGYRPAPLYQRRPCCGYAY